MSQGFARPFFNYPMGHLTVEGNAKQLHNFGVNGVFKSVLGSLGKLGHWLNLLELEVHSNDSTDTILYCMCCSNLNLYKDYLIFEWIMSRDCDLLFDF